MRHRFTLSLVYTSSMVYARTLVSLEYAQSFSDRWKLPLSYGNHRISKTKPTFGEYAWYLPVSSFMEAGDAKRIPVGMKISHVDTNQSLRFGWCRFERTTFAYLKFGVCVPTLVDSREQEIEMSTESETTYHHGSLNELKYPNRTEPTGYQADYTTCLPLCSRLSPHYPRLH